MGKRIIIVLLATVLTMGLASCQQAGNTAAEENSVEWVALNAEEQQIADITSDIVEKFRFAPDMVFDINIYLYQNGAIEENGGMMGADSAGGAKTVIISGRKETNGGYAWGISSDGTIGKFAAQDINIAYSAIASGPGPEQFVMEEGKEYVLVFVAMQEGTSMMTSSTDIFHTWDSIEDKAGALAEFSYAYIITAQLSDAAE